MKKASVRFGVFVVIHILLCISAALNTVEYVQFENPVPECDSSIYVDGADFTPIANMAVGLTNAAFSVLLLIIYFIVMTVLSAVLLIPFRFIAIHKFTFIEPHEAKATLTVILTAVIIIAVILTFFCGISTILPLSLFLFPVLLIEILLYWLTLYLRSKKSEIR